MGDFTHCQETDAGWEGGDEAAILHTTVWPESVHEGCEPLVSRFSTSVCGSDELFITLLN